MLKMMLLSTTMMTMILIEIEFKILIIAVAATGDAHADWKRWIQEGRKELPPYPSGRFES